RRGPARDVRPGPARPPRRVPRRPAGGRRPDRRRPAPQRRPPAPAVAARVADRVRQSPGPAARLTDADAVRGRADTHAPQCNATETNPVFTPGGYPGHRPRTT